MVAPENDKASGERDSAPERWLEQELGRKYLHSEAHSLLSLVGKPELIEAGFDSPEQLARMLKSSGYQPEDFGEVTIGWGRKVGDGFSHEPTSALVVFRSDPDTIYQISIGSEGAYSLHPVLTDSESRGRVHRDMYSLVRLLGAAVSVRTAGRIEDRWGIDIEKLRERRRENPSSN